MGNGTANFLKTKLTRLINGGPFILVERILGKYKMVFFFWVFHSCSISLPLFFLRQKGRQQLKKKILLISSERIRCLIIISVITNIEASTKMSKEKLSLPP